MNAGSSEKLRINSSGELISTNGTLRREVETSSFAVSGGTASNSGANINLYGNNHSSLANVFRVRTGSTERFRIHSNGNVQVKTDGAQLYGAGTLLINPGSSSGRLDVYGGSTNRGGEINFYGGSNNDGMILFRSGAGSNQQSERMRLRGLDLIS